MHTEIDRLIIATDAEVTRLRAELESVQTEARGLREQIATMTQRADALEARVSVISGASGFWPGGRSLGELDRAINRATELRATRRLMRHPHVRAAHTPKGGHPAAWHTYAVTRITPKRIFLAAAPGNGGHGDAYGRETQASIQETRDGYCLRVHPDDLARLDEIRAALAAIKEHR